MTEPATTSPATTESKPAQGREADAFTALRRRMERIFDDFQTGWPNLGRDLWTSEFATPVREWIGGNWGAVDLKENEHSFRFTVELPGCEEKDIDVSAANGMLTLKAEKKDETTDEKAHLTERHYGSYQRTFRLPDGVDRDRIEAHYRKGVLEVTLPKTDAAKQDARRIEIKPA